MTAKAVVGYLLVVAGDPRLCLRAHFAQVAEKRHVEYAAAEAAVETFDEAVLHWPADADNVH